MMEQKKTKDTEYLTWYFNNAPEKEYLEISPVDSPTYSFELDNEKDAERVSFVIQNLKHHAYFRLEDLLSLASSNPDRFEIKEVVDTRSKEI